MPSSVDFSRLTREDWNKRGATALAQELFNLLNQIPTSVFAGTGTGSGGGSGTGTGTGGAQQVFQGTVQSGGPGSSYQVTLDNGQTVTVKQLMIDPTETIPATTVTPVYLLADGTYVMSVPTWGL
jgi:hypothetical protein